LRIKTLNGWFINICWRLCRSVKTKNFHTMMISRKNLFRAILLVPNRLSLSLFRKYNCWYFKISYLLNFSEIIIFCEKVLKRKHLSNQIIFLFLVLHTKTIYWMYWFLFFYVNCYLSK
jgi:hypothetical protein